MRAGGQQLQALLDYMVQTTHPGTIVLDGDTASGRTYMSELTRFRDGRSELNYGIYHDRYQRTSDGWKRRRGRACTRTAAKTAAATCTEDHNATRGLEAMSGSS